MRKFIYDLEVFPNFFSATFKNVDTKEVIVFYKHEGKQNQINELIDFLKSNIYLIGFNNDKYDNLLLNKILSSEITCEDLFNLSKLIISNRDSFFINKQIKELYSYKKPYGSLDLMMIHRFDKLMVGLKQCSVNLKWHKIQDLPKAYDSEVSIDEIDKILSYNLNDVLITEKLFEISLDEIRLRQSVGRKYNVDLMNASRSKMADILMTKMYADTSNLDYSDFKDLRDTQTLIKLSDIVWDKISYSTPSMQAVLAKIKNTTIDISSGDVNFNISVIIDSCRHDIAKGGLHSNNKPDVYESTDDIKLIDVDFGSFYPSLMINLGIYPLQLGDTFLDVLKTITTQRLLAKKNKDKVEADALKIVINSCYGKLGFEKGYMYSPKSMYSVTVNGQLILLMLIEQLSNIGVECFYSNTDGATFKVPVNLQDEFYKVCNDFVKFVNIELEYTEYSKCILRDVNNYLILKPNGEVKEKGSFVTSIQLDKGFNMPVVAKAVKAYFTEGIPVRQFIESHNDIYDFCKSQKVGNQYTVERHYIKDSKHCIEVMQKTNRYYVSKRGDVLYKKKGEQLNNLVAGFTVTIFNDYFDSDDYKIDYDYYVHEANSLIHNFDKSQLSLF